MSRDEIAVLVMVASLALWATMHFVVAFRLARLRPWWHGPVGFVVPPLAPYWAIRAGSRVLGGAWIGLGVVWIVCRVFLAG